jgi:hypothetical protein
MRILVRELIAYVITIQGVFFLKRDFLNLSLLMIMKMMKAVTLFAICLWVLTPLQMPSLGELHYRLLVLHKNENLLAVSLVGEM